MNNSLTIILILWMILYAFLNGTGSYLVKVGLEKVKGLEITLRGLLRNIFRTIFQLLRVPIFILGTVLAVIGFLTYQYALSYYDLSLVKPLQTLSVLFILFWGLKYLHERINVREAIGILALLVGSVFVSIYVSEKSTILNLNNLIIYSIILVVLSIFFVSITIIKKDKKLDEYFLGIASGFLFSLGMIFNNAMTIFEIETNGEFNLSLQLLYNPYLYLLVLSYFFAVLIMLIAYSKGRLSIAASTIGLLSYGLPILGAIFIFNEKLFITFDGALIFPLSFLKLIGILIIFSGISALYPRIKMVSKEQEMKKS